MPFCSSFALEINANGKVVPRPPGYCSASRAMMQKLLYFNVQGMLPREHGISKIQLTAYFGVQNIVPIKVTSGNYRGLRIFLADHHGTESMATPDIYYTLDRARKLLSGNLFEMLQAMSGKKGLRRSWCKIFENHVRKERTSEKLWSS